MGKLAFDGSAAAVWALNPAPRSLSRVGLSTSQKAQDWDSDRHLRAGNVRADKAGHLILSLLHCAVTTAETSPKCFKHEHEHTAPGEAEVSFQLHDGTIPVIFRLKTSSSPKKPQGGSPEEPCNPPIRIAVSLGSTLQPSGRTEEQVEYLPTEFSQLTFHSFKHKETSRLPHL